MTERVDVRGECGVCHRRYRVTKKGNMYSHWLDGGDQHCYGRNYGPVPGTVTERVVNDVTPTSFVRYRIDWRAVAVAALLTVAVGVGFWALGEWVIR
jgi:hypothetical protein